MKKLTPKILWEILKQAASGFSKDNVMKMSASLAFYTIFSLGPMLLVIIFLTDLFWRQEAIEGKLFWQIRELVGDTSALQIQEIIKNVAIGGSNTAAAIIGFVTLILGATSIFTEIQDSINTIWKLKVKAKNGWIQMLKNRLLSFSLLVSLSFLLLVSLIINGLVDGLMDRIEITFPSISVVLIQVVNLIMMVLITSALFAIIFKVLPDAVIHWKDVAVGALFTSLLFMIGKFGITYYIQNSKISSAYGTAGSLVILLVWVYYSSIILYFGTEFTKAYAVRLGDEIKPEQYALVVQNVQVESKIQSIQDNEEVTEDTEKALQKAKDKLDQHIK